MNTTTKATTVANTIPSPLKIPNQRKSFKPSNMPKRKTRAVIQTNPEHNFVDDMLLVSKIVRKIIPTTKINFKRSQHLKDRQFEREIRSRDILDIFENIKSFEYQQNRVWKICGMNGLVVLVAIKPSSQNDKIIFSGITVYPEGSPETISYKSWIQREKEYAKK